MNIVSFIQTKGISLTVPSTNYPYGTHSGQLSTLCSADGEGHNSIFVLKYNLCPKHIKKQRGFHLLLPQLAQCIISLQLVQTSHGLATMANRPLYITSAYWQNVQAFLTRFIGILLTRSGSLYQPYTCWQDQDVLSTIELSCRQDEPVCRQENCIWPTMYLLTRL